jgi:subtilisin-like proprotein convertase family protein
MLTAVPFLPEDNPAPGSITQAQVEVALATLSSTGTDLVIVQQQVSETINWSDQISFQTIQSSPLVRLDELRSSQEFAGIDGSGFAVVILDTGIDLDHPFFGPDTDGDGISDRIVFSYDFTGANDSDASDFRGHGSNVSSIVASSDSRHTGMAPGADIIHLKIFPDSGGGATGRDIEEALQWVVANAAQYNIASVNMSLGYGNFAYLRNSTSWSDEFAALESLNVISVAAAGNDYYSGDSAIGISAPAADTNVISVGAVFDRNIGRVSYGGGAMAQSSGADVITPFSQRHPYLLDVFAPGAPITGAGPTGGLVTQHGTSQATPHVAGAAALAQQLAVRELGRRLSVDEFRHLLSSSSATIHDGDDENDNVNNTGLDYPRLDLVKLANGIRQMRPGSIEGRLFYDLDRDGLSGDEPGLAGQTVYLDVNGNGQRDLGSVTFVSAAGDLAIVDQSMLRSEILVAQPLGQLTDVDVKIDLEHSWNSDLAIYLVSPAGTRIKLVSGVGNGHANFHDTYFDDEANKAISRGRPPYQGSFQPAERLSQLDSAEALGSWVLEVHDRFEQDEGVFHGWSLVLSYSEKSTLSDEDGRYQFAGLSAGTHVVRSMVPPSWVLTSPDPASGGAHQVVVNAGEVTGQVHFGHQTTLQVQVADDVIRESAGAAATSLQISRQGVSTLNELVVTLTYDDQSEIELPAQVVIPAGATSVFVPLGAVDDQLRDGSQWVTITATADEIGTGTTTIEVADHEQLELVVEPGVVHENDGLRAVRLVVHRSDTETAEPLEVQLFSSDTSELVVPAVVTIPAESMSASVMIDVVDDQLLDGLQQVLLTATAGGFDQGVTSVEVWDHEPLGIEFAEHVSWVGASGGDNTLTIHRTDEEHSEPLVVQLSWQAIEGIEAPAQLTVPAGLATASVTIHVSDPSSWSGQRQVSVVASAAGHEDADASFWFSSQVGLVLDADRLSVAENAGEAAIGWTLSRVGGDLSTDAHVTLTSSDTSELVVPAQVVIPAGQATMTFSTDAIDDHLFDGSQQVQVTASADAYDSVTTFIQVDDYETWQNPLDRYDVDQNGNVSPTDVLQVINHLLQDGPRELPINPDPSNAPAPYLDINGDLQLSYLDVDAFMSHFNEVSMAILKAREASAAGSRQGADKLVVERLVHFSTPLLISSNRPQRVVVEAKPAYREPLERGSQQQPVVVEQGQTQSRRPITNIQQTQVRPGNGMIESWRWEWSELDEILDLLVAGQLDQVESILSP